MRHTATYSIDDLVFWKKQLLYWAAGHELGVYLDSNTIATSEAFEGFRGWECLAAADAIEVLEANSGNAFEQLRAFYEEKRDWLFGFFCYDLKNEVEQLTSKHFDGIGLPDLGFFRPETVVGIKPRRSSKTYEVSIMLEIQTWNREPDAVFQEIKTANPSLPLTGKCRCQTPAPNLKTRLFGHRRSHSPAHSRRGYLRDEFLPGVFCRKRAARPRGGF